MERLAVTLSIAVLTWAAAAGAPRAIAAEIAVPIAFDYRILQSALDAQVFGAPGRAVEVYADAIRCNTMALANPGVAAAEGGYVRIRAEVAARVGTPLGSACPIAFEWRGVAGTLQEAYVDPAREAIAFRIVDSTLYRADEQQKAVPDVVWGWIKSHLHPRLEAVTIDLAPAIAGMEELLALALAQPGAPPLAPGATAIRIDGVSAAPTGLDVALVLSVPDAVVAAPPSVQPALTPEDLARWDAAWQAWDGFATWLIKTIAVGAERELADALAETLLEARYDLRDALVGEDRTRDPVRELFLKTWERLAPLLHDTRLAIPGVQALHFATFVSAADALRSLDAAAPQLGMRLDRDGLRHLARLLVPGVTTQELEYGTEVDPALRRLLGLEPELVEEVEAPAPFAWLIPVAHAGQISPALVKRLTGWVPDPKSIDEYLKTVSQLLEQVTAAERSKGKVPAEFLDIYAALVPATAWQETCWRHYVESDGVVKPILSPAGSVGIMQVNRHVWRGIYDLDALNDNVGYNARAGNEILVHYLVDVAIKKKEHEVSGDPQNLARATYAVYNGGPRHLSRYRNPGTRRSLKAIDAAFWEKYSAIRSQGPAAVKQCYGVP